MCVGGGGGEINELMHSVGSCVPVCSTTALLCGYIIACKTISVLTLKHVEFKFTYVRENSMIVRRKIN